MVTECSLCCYPSYFNVHTEALRGLGTVTSQRWSTVLIQNVGGSVVVAVLRCFLLVFFFFFLQRGLTGLVLIQEAGVEPEFNQAALQCKALSNGTEAWILPP